MAIVTTIVAGSAGLTSNSARRLLAFQVATPRV
jgi:hypothetical protein